MWQIDRSLWSSNLSAWSDGTKWNGWKMSKKAIGGVLLIVADGWVAEQMTHRYLPKKSQWWMRRFSSSGLFRRLYLTTTVFMAEATAAGFGRVRLCIRLFVLPPLVPLILLPIIEPGRLVFWLLWWPFEWIIGATVNAFAFDSGWFCAYCCGWVLYGGGGVIRRWCPCNEWK